MSLLHFWVAPFYCFFSWLIVKLAAPIPWRTLKSFAGLLTQLYPPHPFREICTVNWFYVSLHAVQSIEGFLGHPHTLFGAFHKKPPPSYKTSKEIECMERLLIIEDDFRLAQMVTEYLHQSGFDVTHAPSATQGLQLLHQVHRSLSQCKH